MDNETITMKSQLRISLPIAFERLINILMTLVDTLVIALVGTKELAALGAMTVIIDLMQMSIQTVNVSNNTLVAKCIGENKTRLYLYVYDIEKKNRKLIKEMIFPYSIENLRFQLLKDSIYLMNCNGVFSVYEETITQIIKCNGLIDFYID